MTAGCLRFERFVLDPENRRLTRNGLPVELSTRYYDALLLLARNAGRLVTKEQFLEQVWRGVPVTDEALTQCIRTLRRQLGDDAGRPRFVETIPKHGYRFIAPVELSDDAPSMGGPPVSRAWRRSVWLGAAGTIGAGVAGLIGGLVYGLIGAADPLASGMGGASVLLVLVSLCVGVALVGGAGVSFGIAAASLAQSRTWVVIGGGLGGLAVGGIVNLLGLDAFHLLLGISPGNITGAAEGGIIGSAVGLSAYWEARDHGRSLARSIALAALVGGSAGALIPVLGGQMMGGSLEALAEAFPRSRFQLDGWGQLVGERDYGTLSQMLSGWLEGSLFAGCVITAIALARRRLPAAG